MNKVEIYDSGKGKYLYRKDWPEKWGELTRAQFLRIAPILFVEADKYEASAKVIYKLLRRPVLAIKIPFGEIFYLADYVKFIFEDRPADTKFFLKNLWIGLFPGKGPSDNFSDMSAGQFAAAETFFQVAAKNPNDSNALGSFAACLYRPVWQKKFDDAKLARYSRAMRKKKLHLLQAIFFNYMMVRASLALQYPNVFEAPDGEGKSKSKKSKKKDFGWLGVIFKLPGDVFGTLEQRADEPIHNVLMHLEVVSVEAQELSNTEEK